MAEPGVDVTRLPEDVREKLAELELELSEGECAGGFVSRVICGTTIEFLSPVPPTPAAPRSVVSGAATPRCRGGTDGIRPQRPTTIQPEIVLHQAFEYLPNKKCLNSALFLRLTKFDFYS